MLILDRMKVSEINSDKFTDENGNLFVYYTVNEVAQKLKCGKNKASALFKELLSNSFIIRHKIEYGKSPRISIPNKVIKMLSDETHLHCLQSPENQSIENEDNIIPEIGNLISRKQGAINTEYNKTENSNTESSSFEDLNERILEQIEYDCLQGDMRMIKEIALIMTQIVYSPPPVLKINGYSFSGAFVAERFLSLTAEEIQHVIFTLEESGAKVRNAKQYIISLLFNSPAAVAIENSAEYFAAG